MRCANDSKGSLQFFVQVVGWKDGSRRGRRVSVRMLTTWRDQSRRWRKSEKGNCNNKSFDGVLSSMIIKGPVYLLAIRGHHLDNVR